VQENASTMTATIILLRPLVQREFCIRTLLRSGCELVVIDEPTNTLAFAADEFVPVPSVRDEQNVLAAILAVARRRTVVGIMSFVDYLLPVLGRANDALGLPGLSEATARLCTDKFEQRRRFAAHDLPNPEFASISTYEELLAFASRVSFPIVVKPRSRTASIGVSLARNAEEARSSFAYAADEASATGVVVESYLDGQEFGIDVVCSGGRARAISVSSKDFYDSRYFIRRTHWFPAGIAQPLQERLMRLAEKAALALGITDTVVHTQLRLTAEGPVIIEVNARINGGYNADLLFCTTGLNLYRMQADLLRGRAGEAEPADLGAACLQEILLQPGRLRRFPLEAGMPAVEDVVICQAYVQSGMEIAPGRHGSDTHAVIGVRAGTVPEARRLIEAWGRAVLANTEIEPA
jgi:argininosuccinate lyase